MSRSPIDRLLLVVLRLLGLTAGGVVLLVVAFVALESWPAVRDLGLERFLGDDSWHPTEGRYGMLPMLIGTASVTLGAVLVATPVGVGTAVFCHAYAPPRVARLVRRMLEVLAGTPSVVFGFWGLVTLVPLIARVQPPGTSVLAGIVVLSLMILPTVALLTDSSLGRVPAAFSRGASALGLTRWATVRGVLLPAARSGILTGVFLATARALGETMALLMVCGNVVETPGSLFDPVRTLPANIALEMAYALDEHRSALFVTGLLLLTTVAALVSAAQFVGGRRSLA